MMDTERRTLAALGLTPHESVAYLALLDGGPATIAGLSQATGIHRALLYKALPRLLERGLATMSPKGKRTRYAAESPSRLRRLQEALATDMERLLPELETRHSRTGELPSVKWFSGKKGLRTALEDVVQTLKKDEVYYRYSSRKQSTDSERYLTPLYRRLREEKKLQRFVITSETLGKGKPMRMDRAVKTVPASSGLFEHDVAQIVYARKVLYVDYNTETAMIIENPKIAEFHAKVFKLLYDRL